MKMYHKYLSLMLALLMMLGTTAALGEAMTDMADRQVTLKEPAKRVVALTAGDVEILYAIGAGDTLVGRGEYCNYPAEVLEVPSVQSGMETNLEQIVALKPDLVIMAKMAQPQEQVDALEKAGISVAATDAADIAGTYKAIELIGALTGKADEAKAVVADMQARFDALSAKAADKQAQQSVYFEVSPLEFGLWTAGQNTFMQEIAQALHLKNAFEDITGWAEVSQEQVLARDPDYIVTVAMYFGEGPTPVEEIMGRAGWDKLKAVQNAQVILLDSDEISRPGPRLIDAAEHLYELVYGEQQVQPAA
ncbi:MAG: ABC transporter substrate-binding protein [Clostridiales bacterium]|nr:ABC transporter substrate-binding protein [Clostridiales bacterium]